MKNTKISHSQMSKYQTCGIAYKYHYVDKIRPKVHSAALVFGSAMDTALNKILTNSSDNPEVTFERSFTFHEINGENVYIPTYEELVYSKNDFDSDLLTQDDYQDIAEAAKNGLIKASDNYLEDYASYRKRKQESGFDSLKLAEKRVFNLLNWLSLRRKGLLMINAYREDVMPRIEKVHEVQRYVELNNEEGDKIIGYVDLIAEVKGIGTVILDNKTSSMEYEEGAVLTSPQLSLYMHILEEEYKTRKAGYIVMHKSVLKNKKKVCSSCGYDGSGARHKTCSNVVDEKRCNGEWTETIDPKIRIQFLIDEIPLQTEKIVLQNIDETNSAIKNGVFTRNFNSCTNHFGGLCPYYKLCFSNSMNGLVKTGDKK